MDVPGIITPQTTTPSIVPPQATLRKETRRKKPLQAQVSKSLQLSMSVSLPLIRGPFSKPSIHGHKYFLTILDDYSSYTWIVLLKSKSEVKLHIQNFISLIENQFQAKEKIIRHANGPEFLLKDFFASKWILHQTSCVYTPQQNGS